MKLPSLSYGDALYVVWRDTAGTAGWASLDEVGALEPISVPQLGFYVKHDEHSLWIAQAVPPGEHAILAASAIPVGCIESVRKLKL